MKDSPKTTEIEITEIEKVSIAASSAVQLRFLDNENREWIAKLPLDVLDDWLRKISTEHALVLHAETERDHAKLAYPKKAWRLSRDRSSVEPTFSCMSDDGCGIEIGLNFDPVTAAPTLAVTVAAG
jgi:hypothetical protein